MAARLARVMQYQFKAAQEADHPNLIPYMDESDIKKWYFLVTNLPGPFAGGEYIFGLTAPDQFPQKPPEFVFYTKNGVFEPGGKICISIGEFHANDAAGKTGAYGWRSALGMIGFAREVVNGMIDPDYLGGGIRVRNDSAAVKARHAAASAAYNERHHAALMARFRDFEEAHPDYKVVRLRRMWRAAGRAAALDYSTVMLESLPPLFADAFGEDVWSKLSLSLQYLSSIPDLPPAQLAPMGFPATARTVLVRIADQLREALAEREVPIRRVLAYALHARICWELASGEAGDYKVQEAEHNQVFHEWYRRFQEGYAEFLEHLPSVCGSASNVVVPDAMKQVLKAPDAFAKVHADLTRFLRTQDIDEKARLGKIFGARALAHVAETPAILLATPAATPMATPAATPTPEESKEAAPADVAELTEQLSRSTIDAGASEAADTAGGLDDDFIDDLLDDL